MAAAPKPSDQIRDIGDLIEQYIQWGSTQGGRRGHPWGPDHLRKRTAELAWWRAELRLKCQVDLLDCQTKVERVIHRIHVVKGLTGKTTWNKVDSLMSFCRWCVDRGYLDDDPLRRLKPINTDPVSRRRAMSPDEIDRLLGVCTPEKRLLYEVALTTGLRAKELRHITPLHLDKEGCCLRLEAEWTKNRLDGRQPVPEWLMVRLLAAGEGKAQDARLLDIPDNHAARFFDKDLQAAGIPKQVPGEGKLDFHALRTTYATLLDLSGASAKETMELARHSTPVLTLSRYVRATQGRMKTVVEAVGDVVRHLPEVTDPSAPMTAPPHLRLLKTG